MKPGALTRPVAKAVLRTQSDDRLVTLARGGQEPAFAEVVRRYRAPLVAFATAYAPGDRAEDVVQESLERAWLAMQESERDIALKPWLYTIVRNRALNARRDARFHEPLDETIDGVPQPSDIVLQREELSRVVAAVAALRPAERRALVESALEGRTHDQIAKELETTSGAVRGMIFRSRVAVRSAAGAVLPLPLVIALLGGAGATGGATAAAGGTSLAVKGAAVAAVGAVAITSGVAVERSLRNEPSDRVAIVQSEPSEGSGGAQSGRGDDGAGSGQAHADGGGPGDDGEEKAGEGEGPGRRGDDSGHDGPGGEGSDSSGPGSGDGSDSSGSGSGSSGSGSGGSGSSSGSGSESSGPGSGGSAGPGTGSSNSGPGSGSSGSGSSGSGSGGGGSGDSDSPEAEAD